jgi:hypothetical protein
MLLFFLAKVGQRGANRGESWVLPHGRRQPASQTTKAAAIQRGLWSIFARFNP